MNVPKDLPQRLQQMPPLLFANRNSVEKSAETYFEQSRQRELVPHARGRSDHRNNSDNMHRELLASQRDAADAPCDVNI